MRNNAFAPGSKGRDIYDSVAVKNQSRDLKSFMICKDMPPYFGQVNIGEEKVTLSPIKRRDKLGKQSLIIDVIDGVRNFTLKDGLSSITLVSKTEGNKRVPVHPELIKFIKVCVACSYNVCSDFSDVLTFFVHEVTSHCESLILPIDYHSNNKTQKIVAKELNEFLKELCDENGIRYGEVIQAKHCKKTNPMIEVVKKIGDR